MPMLVPLFEISMVLLIVTFFFTQIIVPRIQNRPILPILRKRRRLESKMRKANEGYDTEVMEGEVERQSDDTQALRNARKYGN